MRKSFVAVVLLALSLSAVGCHSKGNVIDNSGVVVVGVDVIDSLFPEDAEPEVTQQPVDMTEPSEDVVVWVEEDVIPVEGDEAIDVTQIPEVTKEPEISESTENPAEEVTDIPKVQDLGIFISLDKYVEKIREAEITWQIEKVKIDWNYTPEFIMDSRIEYDFEGVNGIYGVRGVYWDKIKDELDKNGEVILNIGYEIYAIVKEDEALCVDGFLNLEDVIEFLTGDEVDHPENDEEIPEDILAEAIRRADEYIQQHTDERVVIIDNSYGVYSRTLSFTAGADKVNIGKGTLKIYEGSYKIEKS